MSDPAIRAVLSDPSLLAARQHHFRRLKRLYAGEQLDPSIDITDGHRTVIVADVDPRELMKPSKELHASQV